MKPRYNWREAFRAHQGLWQAWSKIGRHIDAGKRANVLKDVAEARLHLDEIEANLSGASVTVKDRGDQG